MYTYYLTQRPAGPGCQPRKGLIDIEDLDNRFVQEINRMAWSKVTYDRQLTDDEIREYELTPIPCADQGERTIGAITLSEITFTMDSDPTLQRGLLIHDIADEFSNGDAVFPWEDIQTEEDLDQMFRDVTGMPCFEIDSNGIYRCHC